MAVLVWFLAVLVYGRFGLWPFWTYPLSIRTRSYPVKRESTVRTSSIIAKPRLQPIRGHCYTMATDRCRLELFLSQRVVKQWNKLPSHVVTAPSTSAFRNRFD